MANPVAFQKTTGKHLWYSLLSLGFQPEAETSNLVCKTTVKYINLGINMFDKPNKDAFYVVTHFLLDKLDPARFSETYRHCWPVFDRKADTEFRKITFAWLKEIVDENSKSAPKVVASLFLSPGGAKFIALMLHLANHVMLQEMKTFANDGKWAPEEAATPTSSLDIAMKRFKLIKSRLLKYAVQQDHLLQEYQRRAQALVKSTQEIRTEGAKYDNLLKRHENEWPVEGEASAEKLHKVRSLWSAIDQMLSALKEEQQAVACVLQGDSDRHALDGAVLDLKIPRVLLEKIQRLPQQLRSGNVYEAGQLNPLCLLELMNHALQLLKEERSRAAGHAPLAQLRPEELRTRSRQFARVLEELKVLRQKISKEEIPEVRNATRRLELAWDRRWRDTLEDKPLASFLSDDPALCFLSPMAPLSFEPAAEATDSSGVFSRYAAKLPAQRPEDEEPTKVDAREVVDSREVFDAGLPEFNRSTVCPSPLLIPAPAATEPPATEPPANSSLADLLHTLSPSPRGGPSPGPPRPVRQASDKTSHTGCKAANNRAKIVDWECDNLASQFAEAITAASPLDGRRRGLDLEDLLCSLGGDPFSTRKQLHRTPDSLISDVKSSWRKAVEESKVQTHKSPASVGGAGAATRPTPRRQSSGTPARPLALSFNAAAASPFPTAATPQWPPLTSPVPPSPGGIHFCLDDETLPDTTGSDGLLSDPDDDDNDSQLLPASPSDPEPGRPVAAAAAAALLDLDDDAASFPGAGAAWCTPARPEPPGSDTLFTLDLEALDLGALTPPRQEYSLPKLVTFSPMDDL